MAKDKALPFVIMPEHLGGAVPEKDSMFFFKVLKANKDGSALVIYATEEEVEELTADEMEAKLPKAER